MPSSLSNESVHFCLLVPDKQNICFICFSTTFPLIRDGDDYDDDDDDDDGGGGGDGDDNDGDGDDNDDDDNDKWR